MATTNTNNGNSNSEGNIVTVGNSKFAISTQPIGGASPAEIEEYAVALDESYKRGKITLEIQVDSEDAAAEELRKLRAAVKKRTKADGSAQYGLRTDVEKPAKPGGKFVVKFLATDPRTRKTK